MALICSGLYAQSGRDKVERNDGGKGAANLRVSRLYIYINTCITDLFAVITPDHCVTYHSGRNNRHIHQLDLASRTSHLRPLHPHGLDSVAFVVSATPSTAGIGISCICIGNPGSDDSPHRLPW